MKIVTRKLDDDFNSLTHAFTDKKRVYFDIETTGFSTKNTIVYLIGCVYFENDFWYSSQWFAESPSEESTILYDFFNKLNNYGTVVHFNGFGFDIPYIEAKCKKYSLPYDFSKFKSIDIYKEINKYKKILKLDNLKQKTIETFLEIPRKDTFSGGELIQVYQDYVKNPAEDLLDTLLLHNSDDVLGMLKIIDILAYCDLFNGCFYVKSAVDDMDKREACFELVLDNPVPKRISYGFGPYYLTASQNNAKIRIKLHTDELKFFYPNYKDYYYLPVEDTSIHKSVAFYVDKDYRTKAKAANCYSKKTGKFLPQYDEIVSPYFKIDYNDKIKYFEATPEFMENFDLAKSYLTHVLHVMLNKKI